MAKTIGNQFILNRIYLEKSNQIESPEIFTWDKDYLFPLFLFKSNDLTLLWKDRHYKESVWKWAKMNWGKLLEAKWKEVSS